MLRPLMLADNDKSEPRLQMSDGLSAQLIFGIDVAGLKPGEEIIVDENAFGFPKQSIKDIPQGEYYVQALLNVYETFHLKTGHDVKLPPDQGEGQHWNETAGNFYSKPVKVALTPRKVAILKYLPTILKRIQESAPKGADLTTWKH